MKVIDLKMKKKKKKKLKLKLNWVLENEKLPKDTVQQSRLTSPSLGSIFNTGVDSCRMSQTWIVPSLLPVTISGLPIASPATEHPSIQFIIWLCAFEE